MPYWTCNRLVVEGREHDLRSFMELTTVNDEITGGHASKMGEEVEALVAFDKIEPRPEDELDPDPWEPLDYCGEPRSYVGTFCWLDPEKIRYTFLADGAPVSLVMATARKFTNLVFTLGYAQFCVLAQGKLKVKDGWVMVDTAGRFEESTDSAGLAVRSFDTMMDQFCDC